MFVREYMIKNRGDEFGVESKGLIGERRRVEGIDLSLKGIDESDSASKTWRRRPAVGRRHVWVRIIPMV